MRSPGTKSAVVVARLLGTEGFTDHVANQVKRYALRRATKGQRQRWRAIRKAFHDTIVPKLSEGDKRVLGKFIGIMKKMSMDAGLRIGLTAMMHGDEIDWSAQDLEAECEVMVSEQRFPGLSDKPLRRPNRNKPIA